MCLFTIALKPIVSVSQQDRIGYVAGYYAPKKGSPGQHAIQCMDMLDGHVLDEGCELLSQKNACTSIHLPMFINLSASAFSESNSINRWVNRLKKLCYGGRRSIVVEVPASAPFQTVKDSWEALSETGVELALAGMSHATDLGKLEKLNWDYCKVSAADLTYSQLHTIKSACDDTGTSVLMSRVDGWSTSLWAEKNGCDIQQGNVFTGTLLIDVGGSEDQGDVLRNSRLCDQECLN